MSSMPESSNYNIIICNNSGIESNLNTGNSNLFIQLSQSTQGLPLNEFLNFVISNVGNNSEKLNVWSDVLLDVIENDVIQTNDSLLLDVLNLTVNKSQSQSLSSRLFSCKMLAKLSIRLDELIVINKILPIVQCLCHDFESIIRAHMCKQLFVISKKIGLESTKSQILPQLIELSKDKETIVRVACIESVIDLLSALDSETVKQMVLPSIIEMFDEALKANDNSLPFIFFNFGKLCQTLPKDLIAHESWYFKYYCNIYRITGDMQSISKDDNSKERDIQFRTALAISFPILLQMYGPIDNLLSILDSLCSDDNITVAKIIASVFNQIVACLGDQYIVYPQLSKLLCRKNIDVLKSVVPFLADILEVTIISAPTEKIDDLFEDMVKSLVELENTLSVNLDWRLHEEFFENLSRIVQYIPVNLIKNNLISILINRVLTARPLPTRIGASRCILITFRDLPALLQDLNIYKWFVDNLCFGKSCYQRMLFLNICDLIYELCDKTIIVSYIFEPLLHLCKDKVPNVRLKMCKTFKLFYPLLTVPEISEQLNKLKLSFFQMLMDESDRDVIECINSLVDDFEWRLDFDKLEMDELADKLDNLSIKCSEESDEVFEENNNTIRKQEMSCERMGSAKKSCLPQLIRYNSASNSKSPPTVSNNHIANGLHSTPSKIPKPINKLVK